VCVDENDCGGGGCLELSCKCEQCMSELDGRTDGGGGRRRNVQSHKAIQESLNNGRLAAVWQLFTVTTHSHVRKSPFLGD
jgi:hypothetical protein